jgi:hypothetical protein
MSGGDIVMQGSEHSTDGATCPVTWPQVKALLDKAIEGWKQLNGRNPALKQIHGQTFSWATKGDLAAALAKNRRLIEPNKVGNGQGAQTNLVIALREGVSPFPRMPAGGPFLADGEINQIVEWIDAGMPD